MLATPFVNLPTGSEFVASTTGYSQAMWDALSPLLWVLLGFGFAVAFALFIINSMIDAMDRLRENRRREQ